MDGDYVNPEMIPIPNYITLRVLGQLLAQRTQCELLLGRPDAASNDLTLLHGLSRFLDGGSAKRPQTLVSAMINVALTGIYADTIADGLRLQAWNDPQLAAIQSQLTEVHLMPQVVDALQEERAAEVELFQYGSFSYNEPQCSIKRAAVNLGMRQGRFSCPFSDGPWFI